MIVKLCIMNVEINELNMVIITECIIILAKLAVYHSDGQSYMLSSNSII